MLVEEAIRMRRSVRKFEGKPVSNEAIRKIIQAAIYAPSADNGQTWRFTVLTGKEKNKITSLIEKLLIKLSEKYGNKSIGSALSTCNIMKNAPVLILVWNKGSDYSDPDIRESAEQFMSFFSDPDRVMLMVELQGVSAAIQNMLLCAHSLGLGGLWINDFYYVKDELEDYFSYPWELVAAVSLGFPEKGELRKSPPKRLSVDMVTEFR
ncbi:hypothetical protein GF319_07670 [Candidatus Bathyarchaeota archaeon]|nr:hypothetical protein [Candidatus Bathyarchaeota archaeon]